MFHRHKYGEPTKNYLAPRVTPTRVRNVFEDEMNYIMFGCTTVTQTCEGCGYARSYTVPGRA